MAYRFVACSSTLLKQLIPTPSGPRGLAELAVLALPGADTLAVSGQEPLGLQGAKLVGARSGRHKPPSTEKLDEAVEGCVRTARGQPAKRLTC